jgi:hypothetical protein
MSFGNLPTNIYELLGEEGEVAKPAKPAAPKAAPSTQAQPQARVQKPAQDNRQGQKPQGGNRPADRNADLNTDKKKVNRGGKNPADARKPKGVDAPRLERRSGTGRGKEVKRGGAGKGNWGSAENEEETAQPVVEAEVVVEEAPVETEEERAKREAEEKRREEEREKEERQITLDEYLQKKKPVGLEALGLERQSTRAPGEGATDAEKKAWAPLAATKEDVKVAVPEKKGNLVAAEDKATYVDSAKKLSVLVEEFGINVRVRDDAFSRRKAQRFDEERRRHSDERYPKPVSEDPRKQQRKKRAPNSNYKPPQKTDENFPALKA